eukprot:gene20652-biopygen5601
MGQRVVQRGQRRQRGRRGVCSVRNAAGRGDGRRRLRLRSTPHTEGTKGTKGGGVHSEGPPTLPAPHAAKQGTRSRPPCDCYRGRRGGRGLAVADKGAMELTPPPSNI